MSETPPVADRAHLNLREGVRVFGRYTLTTLVGEGGMGVVWSARDETLGREVALKFLPDHVRRDPEAVRDLKRETNRSLALTHENIVRVYTFEEDAQAAAIVMEYVAGRSLAWLKAARPGGCFDVADLAPLVTQLCGALDYAHIIAKVVHRDLKPANLLVTDTGILKVVDFGIARSFQDTSAKLTAVMEATTGTLGYMSPQQLSGSRDEPAHDIYSLGAMLYDLLTGKAPFYKGDIVGQIHSAVPVPMNERRGELENTGAPIPPEWETIIFACLEKESAKRPATAGAVALALGLPYVAPLRTSSPFESQASASATPFRGPSSMESQTPEALAPTVVVPAAKGGAPSPIPPGSGKADVSAKGGQAATGKRGNALLVAGVAAALVVFLAVVFIARKPRAQASPEPAGSAPASPSANNAGASGKAAVAAVPLTAHDFVEQAKINTVIAGPPAKAVINGKVVKAGETVDETLGVVFERVDAAQRTIFFKDKTGASVTRKY